MISRLLMGLCGAFAAGAAASAQDVMPLVRERIVVPGQREAQLQVQPTLAQQRGSDTVRVQVSINLFMPAPTSEGEEADKVRDRARRSIYEFAQRECDILRDVLAKECRLEAINVNVMRQPASNVQQGFNVNGQLTLQVTLK
jgi:hypothetical protein